MVQRIVTAFVLQNARRFKGGSRGRQPPEMGRNKAYQKLKFTVEILWEASFMLRGSFPSGSLTKKIPSKHM